MLMGRIPVTLVLLVLLFHLIAGAQQKEPAEQLKSLIESCQFSQAADLAELYLSRDSTRTDLLLFKGRALAAGFRYREAVAALRKALDYDSANIRVLNELVEIYRQSGDALNAIVASRKLVNIAPGNSYFRLQLANIHYAEEDYRQCASILMPLYFEDSSAFYVAKQLGNCYNELKCNDSAVRFYRRALKITRFDPNVTGKLVNVLIRQKEVAMALYVTGKFLEQDSASIPILKQNGYCYYLLIDFKSSAKQLRECARLGDSSKFTMKYLGLSYYKQEKYDTAAPFFRKAFQRDTTDAEVCFYYGVSASRSYNADTGLVYLERTMHLLMPSKQFLSTLYSELADANTATMHLDTALILLQKALEANPSNNSIRFKIAYQYDYYLRKPFAGLPWYREFLKNAGPVPETDHDMTQQVSYSEYARNRIKEIAK
jgi:tetratricopeptide (TPR) repeat protein